MDGVVVVRLLLSQSLTLTGLIPGDRIRAGVLPQGVILPAISITSVSKTDLNIPSPADRRFVTERVQVSVLAKSYPEQKAVLRAVRTAAADKLYPEVVGVSGITVHTASAGPDFMLEDSIYTGSQDFMVRYNEET